MNSIVSLSLDHERIPSTDLPETFRSAVKNNNAYALRSILIDERFDMEVVNEEMEDENGVSETPLNLAVSRGYSEIVEVLVKFSNPSPDVADSKGYSAIFKAVRQGDLHMLKILLEESGSDINKLHGPHGWTILMEAIYNSHADLVKFLVPNVNDINVKVKGFTALYLAAEVGNLDIIRDLLFVGRADPDIKNGSGGLTAVMTASDSDFGHVLKVLIEEGGANPEAKSDQYDRTALHYAAYKNSANATDYLITQAKLNASQKDLKGLTPFHVAAQRGSLEVIKVMIEKGNVDVNGKSDQNSIPLTTAALHGQTSTVSYLLEHGAQSHVDHLNLMKISPLYYASQDGHADTVKVLVLAGKANVDLQNTNARWTALHIASKKGHLDIVKFLAGLGRANPFLATGDGRDTAISLAQRNGHESIVQYLKDCYTFLADRAEKLGVSQLSDFLRLLVNDPFYTLGEHVAKNLSSLTALDEVPFFYYQYNK